MPKRKMTILVAAGSLLAIAALTLDRDCMAVARIDCRWQYKVLDTRELIINGQLTSEQISEMAAYGVSASHSLEQAFDRFGAEGWEMVSYADEMAVFKRCR